MASSSSTKAKKGSKSAIALSSGPQAFETALASLNTGQWTSLPFSISIKIMQLLGDDFKAAAGLGTTCLFWRLIYASDELWQYHLLRKFLHLESSDQFFLQNRALPPKNLASASPSLQLFGRKFVQWQAWGRGGISMSDTAIPRCGSDDDQYIHMIRWREYFVTSTPDGRVLFWNPERFEPEATFDINVRDTAPECQAVRIEYPHTSSIYCMRIVDEFCYTATQAGEVSVSILDSMSIRDRTLLGLETYTLVEGLQPIHAMDVSLTERVAVIGTTKGEIFAYELGNTASTWKLIRKFLFGSELHDLCLLPGRRFAASGLKDIEIYNIGESTSSQEAESNTPSTSAPSQDAASSSDASNAVKTPPDLVIPSYLMAHPELKPIFEIKTTPPRKPLPLDQQPACVTRNLRFVDGLLVVSISTLGVEAWDVDRVELVWNVCIHTLDIRHMERYNHKLALVGIEESTMESALVLDMTNLDFLWEATPYKPINGVASLCVTDDAFYLCSRHILCHHKVKSPKSIDTLFSSPASNEKKRKGACVIS